MHSGIVAYWHTDSERISCITGDQVHFIINIRWNQIIGYDTRISIRSLLVPAWWRHQMETFSALLALCVGNSPITGEFPAQRPVTRSFDVFFDLRLNKRLSKQSWGWRFETPSRPLWRHCNGRSKDQQWPSHTWSKDQASGAGTTSGHKASSARVTADPFAYGHQECWSVGVLKFWKLWSKVHGFQSCRRGRQLVAFGFEIASLQVKQ